MVRSRFGAWLRRRADKLDPQPEQSTPDRPEVYIDTPGPSITIKASGDLDTIAAKALQLYRDIDLLDRAKSPGPATGFSAERSVEW
jgi:hypothetical protein